MSTVTRRTPGKAIFLEREIKLAYAYAAAGGQALHVCYTSRYITASSPGCFKRSEYFAHLLDQNFERLVATAKRFGVRVIRPERIGEPGQHIDLCGKPLKLAVKNFQNEIEKQKAQEKAVFSEMKLG